MTEFRGKKIKGFEDWRDGTSLWSHQQGGEKQADPGAKVSLSHKLESILDYMRLSKNTNNNNNNNNKIMVSLQIWS